MHGQTHPPLPPVALDLVWLQQLVRYTNFPTRPLRQSIGYEHSQEVSTLRSRAAMSMWSPPLAPASGHFGRIEIATRHRSEEHTSELQSLMRISYAVFCLKKQTQHKNPCTHFHVASKKN